MTRDARLRLASVWETRALPRARFVVRPSEASRFPMRLDAPRRPTGVGG